MASSLRRRALVVLVLSLGLLPLARQDLHSPHIRAQPFAQTPIQYLVVIDQEGASFDHFFATYPSAANPTGDPAFVSLPSTPSVDGISPDVMTSNPNLSNPFRLGRASAYACNPSNRYDDEQRAYDGGMLDQFVQSVARPAANAAMYCPQLSDGSSGAVMGYFDGNTVTALWNLAQHFAIGDSYVATTFGASTLGAVHLISGDTDGAVCGPATAVYGGQPPCGASGAPVPDTTSIAAPANGSTGSLVFEADPFWDTCASVDVGARVALSGLTIGDLLDGAGVTWGWFQGGFALTSDGACDLMHVQEAYDADTGIDPASDPDASVDYAASREPFQFFQSTANPQHLPPDSVATVGHDDQANHQYDLSYFWEAAESGNLPAVSFLKAPAYQAGRAGVSNPLDEQQFLVETIDRLQRLPQWSSMAIIVTWDDSGGWYDHVAPRNVNQSDTALDFECGDVSTGDPARCGYGPRLPILAISPFAKQNYVSHALIDQTSITRFIEDNWLGGQRLRMTSFDNIAGSLLDMFNFGQPSPQPLILDPLTGEPAG